MTSQRTIFLTLGLLATSAALAAFSPQSYLDGDPQTRTDTHLYPVRIVGVDGVTPHGNPVAVTPGAHWVEIQAPPADSMSRGRISKSQTFVLKIEPCARYFFGAHKDSPLADKWKLVVDKVEIVKGCDPDEELRKFPDPSQVAPKAPAAH